ncbi:hypothetical protein MNBD_CHLOROFLEXI01-1814 [hydrothermal vent metagenome]|uniref:Uncharacterized protein n=1 Tax=hydrothermal vent metagenome TaxID=652676 RepID=A0A3B0V8F0_9ZZZZ
MAERLSELYPVETAVEIWLNEQVWLRGVVISHQHPAVWVNTEDGRSWFVTNRRRIRLVDGDTEE